MPAKKDQQPNQPVESQGDASGRIAGASRMKTMIVVAAVLLVEGAAIVGVMLLVTGPPAVDASNMLATLEGVAGDERVVETMILHAKLPNNRTGMTYLYDTEIYVQTAQRHVPRIQSELEQFQNEIRAEIAAIWRAAEPHHFQEPNLENLTRRVHALLSGRFGMDENASLVGGGSGGEPIIRRCVIVMGTGFRIDS